MATTTSRYTLPSNRLTTLQGHPEDADTVIVELRCRTSVEDDMGSTLTHWLMDVERDAGGDWMITRITMLSMNLRPVSRLPW